jgi:hypothetical protein
MASWALTCKNCGKVFTHWRISDKLADYFLSPKPAFPLEGLECECPNCRTKSNYRQNELRYRGE